MADLSGKTIGPYEIQSKLGQGGMSAVYLAHQSTMGRAVAIKILPVLLAQDSKFVERFRREAHLIARLEHPRILPIYDYGEEEGLYYIVTRYLKAGTLAQRIKAGNLLLEEIADIFSQIAQGLDYAHQNGVIHRDIKSSNFMLDHNGDVFITDFGLSRMIEDSDRLTSSGIMGTPEYMAPEQGMDVDIDYRIDIYSLGVVLYEMLVGQVPFTGNTGTVIMVKHIRQRFPDPSAIRPEIPKAVADVVLKATAKLPAKRYQSCKEMSDALNAAITGKVRARPRYSKRWLIPGAAGGLVLVAALAFSVLSGTAASWLNPAPTPAPPIPNEAGLITCEGDTQLRVAFDFRAGRPENIAVFEGESSAITFNSDSMTIDPGSAPSPGMAVPLRTGGPLTDVDILIKLAWPSTRGALQIASRVNPDTHMGYRAGFEPLDVTISDLHRALRIWRGRDPLISGPIVASLLDGDFHTLRFTLIGGKSTLAIDDVPKLVTRDPNKPLPAGLVQLIVGGGPIRIDMLAVCGS